jgi:mRNA-degrading endonuclease RelE of RelBE toxin-antitoxin system
MCGGGGAGRLEFKNMSFKINIKEPAERWLRKYDREIQKRFAVKICKLKENPEIHGKPLRGVLHGYWESILRIDLEYYIRLIIKSRSLLLKP